MLRVFVSSTFIDLEEYRKSVCDIIRQLGAVDVAMEHLGARDERPKEECLWLVKDSDAFIGIYAHRYGSIPTGETKSITEMEYEEALASGKKCLIYIVDESLPWQPKFIDVGTEAELLASFKKRLREKHVSKLFTSKDQLSASVAADLAHYFPFTPELTEKWRAEQKIAVSKELSSAGSVDKDSFEAVPPIIIKEPSPTSGLKTEAKVQPGLPKVTSADLVRAGFRPDRVHMILSTQDQALKAGNHRLGQFLSDYVDVRWEHVPRTWRSLIAGLPIVGQDIGSPSLIELSDLAKHLHPYLSRELRRVYLHKLPDILIGVLAEVQAFLDDQARAGGLHLVINAGSPPSWKDWLPWLWDRERSFRIDDSLVRGNWSYGFPQEVIEYHIDISKTWSGFLYDIISRLPNPDRQKGHLLRKYDLMLLMYIWCMTPPEDFRPALTRIVRHPVNSSDHTVAGMYKAMKEYSNSKKEST